MEYSCDKDNDTSGLQNHDAEDDKMVSTNDAKEAGTVPTLVESHADDSNDTDGEEKDITGRLWTLAPMSERPK